MTNVTKVLGMLILLLAMSCSAPPEEPAEAKPQVQKAEDSPNEMLIQAYQLFKEGNDAKSIELANRVLEIGRETKNDTLIGRALTSLCRNSQRKLDTLRLAELSAELREKAEIIRF